MIAIHLVSDVREVSDDIWAEMKFARSRKQLFSKSDTEKLRCPLRNTHRPNFFPSITLHFS